MIDPTMGDQGFEAATTDGVPAVGATIAGKFRVDKILGAGGMGIVVAATHLQLGERVALKFLRRNMLHNPETVARFAQEARAAVRLKGQHIARVLDVGSENGMPYMVMEFLEGKDLGETVRQVGPLPPEEAVDLVIQACEGLAEAHAKGIVHRDIKPENLFLTVSHGWKSVKILDFGISKADVSSATRDGSIQTSQIMGSPCYMSPEQLRSTRNVDQRADIWSLGCVLFELLSGTTAFDTTVSLPQLVANITIDGAHRDLKALRPELPKALIDVVTRCLARDLTARFQNVAELALALAPFAPRRARNTVERTVSLVHGEGSEHSASLLPSEGPPSFAHGQTVAMPNAQRSSSIRGPSQAPVSGARETSTAMSSQDQVGRNQKSSLFVSIIAVVLAAGIGAGVISFLVQRAPGSAAGPAAESTLPSPLDRPAPVDSIEIVLKADPPETRFFIDEGPALENPYVGKRTKDATSHTIRARAPGYKDKVRQVNFGANVSLGLLLDPNPSEKKDGGGRK